MISEKEKRVCLEDQFSSFGIYNESPERPDGAKIMYIVYDKYLDHDTMVSPASLWVCDRDLKNHQKIKQLEEVVCNHNGAFQQWVDNKRIAYSGTHLTK